MSAPDNDTRIFNPPVPGGTSRPVRFTIFIREADDVPGQWVVQVAGLNLISQGNSAAHAEEMIREAIQISWADDRERGFDFFDRKSETTRLGPGEIRRTIHVELAS